MASQHPDYEYDIFISYRQNDNKRDGWVTKFVQALQDELDATVKNPISIYFDENPHDGLLETHQVQESLDEKLRCLIFIPIVSQTYCDTNSYAWNGEFQPFKRIASEDQLGLNVKLRNGNYSSRILPVRIHDIDADDEQLLADELGGPVRAIDFIYAEPGVNRPLTPADDPSRNLNGTLYRNQVNKLANAIKEIGSAILNPAGPEAVADPSPGPKAPVKKGNKSWFLVGALAIIAILIASWFYSNRETKPADRELTIAVMAFTDNSPTGDQEWLGNGVAESIINDLTNIKGLKVIGKRSSFSFKGRNATIKEIGEALQVYSILEGSVSKVGDQLRITVELIDTESEVQIWNKQYDLEWGDVHEIMDDLSANIVQSLIRDFPQSGLVYTKGAADADPRAYEFYLKGVHYHWERYILNRIEEDFFESEMNFQQALEVDPAYMDAIAGMADLYDTRAQFVDSASQVMYLMKRDSLIDHGYQLDPQAPYLLAIKGFSIGFNNFDSAFYYMRQAYALDPDNTLILTLMQNAYTRVGLLDESNIVSRHILKTDPLNQMSLANLSQNLLNMGLVAEARSTLDELLKHYPDNRRGLQVEFDYLVFYAKKISEAQKLIDRLDKEYPGEYEEQKAILLAISGKKEEALATLDRVYIYCLLGMKEEAMAKFTATKDNRIHRWGYILLKNYPALDLIRSEPEFIAFEQDARVRYEQNLKKYGGVIQATN
jgi:TolB-like protein/Tfp pilus assembly protein PilF